VSEILRIENLVKTFGGVVAIDGVSLSIEKGKIIGLIGPNGSGKSTLFKVIAGIYRPDRGEVFFKGEKITGLPPHRIFRKGIVKSFQIPSLFYNMTTLENFMAPPKDQIGERAARALFRRAWTGQEISLAKKAVNLLRFLQLADQGRSQAKGLSGGQMKLCEIGRGLMGEPTLMLLDEPTAGVAPNLAREILEMIERLRRELGVTFFIIEHRLEIFLEYVDYVHVMHLGKVVYSGSPHEVTEAQLVQEVYLGRELLG